MLAALYLLNVHMKFSVTGTDCHRYSTIVLLQNKDLHELVCLARYLLKVIVLPQLYEIAQFVQ